MVRSSLSHDDRELIRSGPRWVMIAQQAIDQGDGRVEIGREEDALKEMLADYSSDNTLVKLATAVGADEKYGDKDADAARALAQLRKIEDVLEKVDPDEGDEYRDFLMEVGTKIVQATGRGVLGVGRKTSGGERRALEQIEAALKARETDKRARATRAKRVVRRETAATAAEQKESAEERRQSAAAARDKLAAERQEAIERRQRDAAIRKAKEAQAEAEKAAEKRMADARRAKERQEHMEMKREARAARKAAAEPQTYTVQAGDSLWKIAAETLGDGNRWKEIHEANKDQIKDPSLIRPGQELTIPEK